jgi:formylmethanofuran dehydrogenase subunit E
VNYPDNIHQFDNDESSPTFDGVNDKQQCLSCGEMFRPKTELYYEDNVCGLCCELGLS